MSEPERIVEIAFLTAAGWVTLDLPTLRGVRIIHSWRDVDGTAWRYRDLPDELIECVALFTPDGGLVPVDAHVADVDWGT